MGNPRTRSDLSFQLIQAFLCCGTDGGTEAKRDVTCSSHRQLQVRLRLSLLG